LPDFGLTFEFEPTDFTQVNAGLKSRACPARDRMATAGAGRSGGRLLLRPGNFTLPVARQGAQVVGVEVSHSLVRRAETNAAP